MNKNNVYLSTTASDAAVIARQYCLGVEIAEYCTAWNMDELLAATDASVREKLDGADRVIFHAPFNELFPCAIDQRARALAADRYRQAIKLAKDYGATKVVIHGAYNPHMYYPQWYTEQSVVFWKAFLQDISGVQIVLENVLETDPAWLLNIVKAVNSPMLRLCLDIGHVNAYSDIPLMQWLTSWAPYISHFHIHNNDASGDTHSPLTHGTIPMQEFLECASRLCPNATFTLELMQTQESVKWLTETGLMR